MNIYSFHRTNEYRPNYFANYAEADAIMAYYDASGEVKGVNNARINCEKSLDTLAKEGRAYKFSYKTDIISIRPPEEVQIFLLDLDQKFVYDFNKLQYVATDSQVKRVRFIKKQFTKTTFI